MYFGHDAGFLFHLYFFPFGSFVQSEVAFGWFHLIDAFFEAGLLM